jgi:hypothetical protein
MLHPALQLDFGLSIHLALLSKCRYPIALALMTHVHMVFETKQELLLFGKPTSYWWDPCTSFTDSWHIQ